MTKSILVLSSVACSAFVLVSGCGSSVSSADDFTKQFIAALCHAEAQCGSFGISEEARCRDVTASGYSQTLDALSAKRLSFDSGTAGKCLDAIKSSGCRLEEIL